MSAISNDLETKLINHLLRNTQHTTPGLNVYVALFDADPGDDGTGGTEKTGLGGYARQQVTVWDVPSNGATQNTNAITFGPASGSWGTVAGVAIFDALSGGNMLFHGACTSRSVGIGDSYRFAVGDLDVSLA